MRTIRRYPNRKLYDVHARRYVTLQGIRDLVRAGERVQVVHSQTGDDLTKEVLSKIVLEGEMMKGGELSVALLSDLIKKSSRTVIGYLKKSWEAGVDAARKAEEDWSAPIQAALKTGRRGLSEAQGLKSDLVVRVKQEVARRETYLEDQIQKGITLALSSVNLATKSDMAQMRSKLSKLESRVNVLSRKRKATADKEETDEDRIADD